MSYIISRDTKLRLGEYKTDWNRLQVKTGENSTGRKLPCTQNIKMTIRIYNIDIDET